jgi:phosphatidylglycerophosphate synthase
MASQGLARRPLKSRNTRWAASCAQILIRLHVRPNHISIFSIVVATSAGACFLLLNRFNGSAQIVLFLTAAVLIQLRLLCNLLDGMVAIEGGFRSPAGDVFNELPDRISDIVVLVPIGYALPNFPLASELAWSAALLAVLTAYIRALGASLNMPQDFAGPMAKPQRMFVGTAGCLLSCLEVLSHRSGNVMGVALVIVAIGSLITVVRRTVRLIRWLEGKI